MSTTSTHWLFFAFLQTPNGSKRHRRLRIVSPQRRGSRKLSARVLALCACVLGCGSFDVPRGDVSTNIEFGQAAFALTAEAAGKAYALRDAQFVITGSETVTLDSGDAPDETTL